MRSSNERKPFVEKGASGYLGRNILKRLVDKFRTVGGLVCSDTSAEIIEQCSARAVLLTGKPQTKCSCRKISKKIYPLVEISVARGSCQ